MLKTGTTGGFSAVVILSEIVVHGTWTAMQSKDPAFAGSELEDARR